MSSTAAQITSPTIVYWTVYSDADQRKHQSSASLAFVRGIHRGPVNSPHKWPVTRKMFPFDDVIMEFACHRWTLCLTETFDTDCSHNIPSHKKLPSSISLFFPLIIHLMKFARILGLVVPLQWRHDERDGVSNHRRLDRVLNHLFRRRSKKTSKPRVTGLCDRWITLTMAQ